MIAHARAIGDATLERKLLQELHATAARSEEATPPVLSSVAADDDAIDALHEAVAAAPRDPAAWLALARAHAERRDWHEGVLASFPAVLLTERSAHNDGAKAAAAAAKRLLGRCAAMLLPKGWLPAANGSLEWAAASLERAAAAAAQRGGRVDRVRVCGVGLAVAALHAVASAGHSRAAPRRLELSSHPTLGPLLARALQANPNPYPLTLTPARTPDPNKAMIALAYYCYLLLLLVRSYPLLLLLQAAGSRVALSEVSVRTHSAPGALGGGGDGGGGGGAVVVDQHGSEGAAPTPNPNLDPNPESNPNPNPELALPQPLPLPLPGAPVGGEADADVLLWEVAP